MSVLALLLLAAPPAAVPLRDIKPGFVHGGSILRSRTKQAPGLAVGGKRRRGLNCPSPSRVGFHTNAAFSLLDVQVAVLDGGRKPVAFKVIGDGRTLSATPPLFSGDKPVRLQVDISRVLLLELVAVGEGQARALWLDGRVHPAEGRDLGPFRALDAPFSPRDYPTSFRRRVNAAIDRGVAYLLSTQDGGTWEYRVQRMGATALATLALLKAGVKPRDPHIVAAFRWLRPKKFTRVYSTACLLMAIEARYFPGGADEKNAYLDRPKKAKHIIPGEEQRWIGAAAKWLASQQGAGFPPKDRRFHPVWRYPQGGYDLSNTQYALLGLSAANRCGVGTGKVWLRALRYLLGAQEKQGPPVEVSRYFRAGAFMRRRSESAQARGFGYRIGSRPTGSMTSAGLCSLILCRQALHRSARFQTVRKRTRAGIRDALAWLEEYYDVSVNPFYGDTWWDYYLFNLERVGVLLDERFIGTRDWYREGSLALMKRQAPNGAVRNGPVGTAFALLFWKRATVPAITIDGNR